MELDELEANTEFIKLKYILQTKKEGENFYHNYFTEDSFSGEIKETGEAYTFHGPFIESHEMFLKENKYFNSIETKLELKNE